jgi:hypothetical protein
MKKQKKIEKEKKKATLRASKLQHQKDNCKE